MFRWRKESVLDLYVLALAAFLLASPWLFGFVYEPARLDAWVVGVVLIALSLAALLAFTVWEEWLMVLLGLWMMAAPFVLGFPHAAAMKIHVGVGLVVAYLALIELYLVHYGAERDKAWHP